MRDDMPENGLLITCEHCGFSWNDGDHGMQFINATNVKSFRLKNNKTNCPHCGKMASLPEGDFNVLEGQWRLIRTLVDDLRSAQATNDDYAKLFNLLREAQKTGEEAGQVADEIATHTPFVKLADTIRAHPPGWIAWLIAALLSIALWRFPYQSGETAVSTSSHPSSPPIVSELTSRQLDELAKQIATQLEQRQNVSHTGKMPISRQKGSQRNKPCPCGSGVKYKRCCGGTARK